MKTFEFSVGIFMIAGLLALALLTFKVSGLVVSHRGATYTLTAEFDNVGDLKVRAPVSISGVTIGQVSRIQIDPNNFRAIVTMQIHKNMDALPTDTAADILTQGILGANYISLTPGFDTTNLKNGDRIQTTHPALILENLVGQLLYNFKNQKAAGK